MLGYLYTTALEHIFTIALVVFSGVGFTALALYLDYYRRKYGPADPNRLSSETRTRWSNWGKKFNILDIIK